MNWLGEFIISAIGSQRSLPLRPARSRVESERLAEAATEPRGCLVHLAAKNTPFKPRLQQHLLRIRRGSQHDRSPSDGGHGSPRTAVGSRSAAGRTTTATHTLEMLAKIAHNASRYAATASTGMVIVRSSSSRRTTQRTPRRFAATASGTSVQANALTRRRGSAGPGSPPRRCTTVAAPRAAAANTAAARPVPPRPGPGLEIQQGHHADRREHQEVAGRRQGGPPGGRDATKSISQDDMTMINETGQTSGRWGFHTPAERDTHNHAEQQGHPEVAMPATTTALLVFSKPSTVLTTPGHLSDSGDGPCGSAWPSSATP